MSTKTSYPIRLEAKIIDSVRPIAKREGRTIKAQIERIIQCAVNNELNHEAHIRANIKLGAAIARAKP